MRFLLSLCLRTAVMALVGAAMSAHAAAPSEWRAWFGKSYRLEADGNLSCYSTDGINCYGAVRPATAKASDDKPLTCGAAHRAIYGITGYDRPGHWCTDAYANLFAQWRNYQPLGLSVRLAFTPDGHAMCESYDSVHCLWNQSNDGDAPQVLGRVAPLVCGEAHRLAWGETGEDRADHWCNLPEIVAIVPQPLQGFAEGIETTVSVPTWTQAEQPAWIVHAELPRNTLLVAQLPVMTNFTGAMSFGLAQTPGDQILMQFPGIAVEVPLAHPNGDATFAIRLDAQGHVHYHAANGRAPDILSPTREIPIDQLGYQGVGTATMTPPAHSEMRLALMSNEGASPTGKIVSLIAVRRPVRR